MTADTDNSDDLELDEELDEDLDVEVDEDLDEDLDGELDGEIVIGDDDVDAALDDDDLAGDRPAAERKADEDDEDEEVADSDDVEADLSAILKDRIAAAEDDEDEEEAEAPVARGSADTADGVTPRRADEFMCTGCFLLVNRQQFGPSDALECPIGDADCPAIAKIRKSSRKR